MSKGIKWPSFIMATAQNLLLVEQDKVSTLHTGAGIYYGITWDENEVYVAHRKGLVGRKGPEVAVFNQSLQYSRTIEGDFNDVHQIIYVPSEQALFVTATGYNAIARVDRAGKVTMHSWTKFGKDVNHINSIWFDGKDFWACYHNFVAKGGNTTSRIVRVDAALETVKEAHDVGRDIHCAFVSGDLIYIGDSGNGQLLVYNRKTSEQKTVKTEAWTRGIAATEDYLLVGASTFAERRHRLHGHCEVNLLDRKTLKVLDVRRFEDAGAVMEIRVTNIQDYAHNKIPFPGVKW